MPKEELCCIVNTIGNCVGCKQKKCNTHGFKCWEDDKVFCRSCDVSSECVKCGEDVCKKHTRLNDLEEIVCYTCYTMAEDDNYDNDNPYEGCPCGCGD